ncbi:hypothetical protein ASE91_18135, partial [Sphingomonas sp. Leaf62]
MPQSQHRRPRQHRQHRQHRQLAAILADYATEQRANEAFQKDIAVGTETNCGTVIQVRGAMVEIALPPVRPTPNGQSTFWSKRTALSCCRFRGHRDKVFFGTGGWR